MVLKNLKKHLSSQIDYSSNVILLTIPLLLICLADLLNRVFVIGLISKSGIDNIAIIGLSSEIFRISLELILSWNLAFQIVSGAKVKSKDQFDSYLVVTSMLIFISALVICALIYSFNDILLGVFKQSADINNRASDFITTRLWSMPFYLTSRVFLSVFLINKEKKSFTLFCILEAFLTFTLLYTQSTFGWIRDPLNGTAISFLFKDTLIFLILISYITISRKITLDAVKISLFEFLAIAKDLNRTAFPELLNSILLFSSSFIFFTISSWMGISSLALFKIIIELTSFLWMLFAQFGTSIQIVTSNYREINNHMDLIKNQQIATFLTVIISIIIVFPLFLFPDTLTQFYTDDIALTNELNRNLKLIIIMLPMMIIINANNGLLRGLRKNSSLVITNILSFYFFLIPLAFSCWYFNYGGVDIIIFLFLFNYVVRAILTESIVLSNLRSKPLVLQNV